MPKGNKKKMPLEEQQADTNENSKVILIINI